ncbi:MAG: hypothetical protein R3B06_03185 [Kofleriaceae bacterium]
MWLLATVLAGCGGNDDTPGIDGGIDTPVIDAPAPDAAPAGYRAEVVQELTFVRDGRTFPVQLVRVLRPDGGRTYLQWMRSDRPIPRPTVLSTDPYGGIDWTGEAVDARWAGRPSGLYQDVDGPDYDGDALIVYFPMSVATVEDQEYIHLLNDANVLRVHGRFYAGGDLADDVADMAAGMWFLSQQPGLDPARVGTYGGSWGGFESLYASAYGDRRVAPRVTVALYPPVDFGAWLDFAEASPEPLFSAIEGHRRRVRHTTGGSLAEGGDFTGYTAAGLCAGLPADTLVLHDALDGLVPIAQSRGLVATCGGDAVYWPRATTPAPGAATHGPLLEEGNGGEPGFVPAAYTYGLVYLHLRLRPAGEGVVAPVWRPSMQRQLAELRAAQLRGEPVAFAAPRLRELCDPRVTLYDLVDGALGVFTGAAVVAELVNQTWGTSYTATTIAAALAAGLPPP